MSNTIGQALSAGLATLKAEKDARDQEFRELERLCAEAAEIDLGDLVTAPAALEGIIGQLRSYYGEVHPHSTRSLEFCQAIEAFAQIVGLQKMQVNNAVQAIADAEREEAARLARIRDVELARERQQAAEAAEARLLAQGDLGAYRRHMERQAAAAGPSAPVEIVQHHPLRPRPGNVAPDYASAPTVTRMRD